MAMIVPDLPVVLVQDACRALRQSGFKDRGQVQVSLIEGAATHRYAIDLAWTRLPSGGSRPWFRCPTCGRRAGRLYVADVSRAPSCRLCAQVKYIWRGGRRGSAP